MSQGSSATPPSTASTFRTGTARKKKKYDYSRGKYFPSNSSWFPQDLKVVPYFFKKSWKLKKVRPSNIQLFKLGFHGGPSFFDFQLFYQQKFSGKEIEYGLAAIIQL